MHKRDENAHKRIDKRETKEKVLTMLYGAKTRRYRRTNLVQKTSALAHFLVPVPVCFRCNRKMNETLHVSAHNTRVCSECEPHIQSMGTQLDTDIEDLGTQSRVIWENCMKCMNAPREEVADCVCLSCPHLGERAFVDTKLKNMSKRREHFHAGRVSSSKKRKRERE